MPNQFQDIPLAGDLLSISQGDLKQNFDYIQGSLGKDHQLVFGHTDTGTTFEGRHIQVSLNDRTNANLAMPGDGTDSLLWSSSGNLYWKDTTIASGVQITNKNVLPSAIANGGFSFLPGGIMICWGTTAFAGTSLAINFPNGGFTTVFVCNASLNVTREPAVTSLNNTGFTLITDSSAGGSAVYWMAIGAK
jgi:hypothetical protein